MPYDNVTNLKDDQSMIILNNLNRHHQDFLANFQAKRIEHDKKIAAARETTEAMLSELKAFDIETNNVFNKGSIK